eukprot:Em0021g92a
MGLPHQTIEDLSSNDPSTAVQLVHCTADDGVSPHNGIISQDGELVRSGDFIELASCQWSTNSEFYDCPLITATRTLYTVDFSLIVFRQLVSWPPNSSHCPFDLVALHFIASGDFSGCYMDGKKFEGGVIISTIPPDKINITVVFTVDRPNVLRSLNCCVQLDSQSSCSPLVWFSTEGAPVQEGCVKATQYSFAVNSMDWCGTYEVTSTTKCNTAVSDTYRGTLTPVERGLLKDEITYDLNCTKDGQTQEVVICSVVRYPVGFKTATSSATFGVLKVVASLSPDGGNLTATCFFAPGSCATGCFLIMSNGVSVNGLMTYRVRGAPSAMASVPAQGLVLGLYRGTAYSTDSFGLLSGGGPSAAFSLNVSTHNQSPATRDSRLMCRAEGSFICCTCRLSSSCQYIVVSLESGNIVEKTAGALSSAYCSQSLPPGNYGVFVIYNGSSKQGAIMSDTILIPSPSGSTKTDIAAIVVPVILVIVLLIAAAAAAAAAAIIRHMRSNKKKGRLG